MKKKNKKNHIRMRFSTLLLCILAFVLCAAPRGWAVIYNDGDEYGEHDVKEDIVGCLEIGTDTTVNLYADVSEFVSVSPGGILNIYSGNVGLYVVLTTTTGEQDQIVTVYGTNFSVDGVPLDSSATQFTVENTSGVLTGNYGGDGGPIDLWFISKIPIYLGTTDDPKVEIDIKPGSDDNSINLKSKGVVPVAVLTTEDFNASDVDPTTVEFAGAKPVRWKLCDVDDDGEVDMLFHFKTKDLVELDENSTKATLTGMTFGGEDIELTDEVRIVPQKKKK